MHFFDIHHKLKPFHLSFNNIDNKIFTPRIPLLQCLTDEMKKDIDSNGIWHMGDFFEDTTIKRVCFGETINGCINAITDNTDENLTDSLFIKKDNPSESCCFYWDTKEQIEYSIFVPEKPLKDYQHLTNKKLIENNLVSDAIVTSECWILEPVKMKLWGKLILPPQKAIIREIINPINQLKEDKRFWTFEVYNNKNQLIYKNAQ